MKNHLKALATLAALISLSGCYTISKPLVVAQVIETTQTLSVEAREQGRMVPDAHCKLVNDKGEWFLTVPGTVNVARSDKPLSLACRKEGVLPGLKAVEARKAEWLTRDTLPATKTLPGFEY